jgi:hypothetical protein
MSVPSSIRPVTSSATDTCNGTRRPASSNARRAPVMAARVLHRLDLEQVDAAREQPGRLLAELLDQLRVRDRGQGRVVAGRQHPGRADRPGHEARPEVGRELVRHGPRQLRRDAVVLEREVAEAPLLEADPRRLERVRDQVVGAGVEVGAVDLADRVRRRQREVVDVAGVAAVGRVIELGRLDLRAHRAVLQDRARAHQRQVAVGIGDGQEQPPGAL